MTSPERVRHRWAEHRQKYFADGLRPLSNAMSYLDDTALVMVSSALWRLALLEYDDKATAAMAIATLLEAGIRGDGENARWHAAALETISLIEGETDERTDEIIDEIIDELIDELDIHEYLAHAIATAQMRLDGPYDGRKRQMSVRSKWRRAVKEASIRALSNAMLYLDDDELVMVSSALESLAMLKENDKRAAVVAIATLLSSGLRGGTAVSWTMYERR